MHSLIMHSISFSICIIEGSHPCILPSISFIPRILSFMPMGIGLLPDPIVIFMKDSIGGIAFIIIRLSPFFWVIISAIFSMTPDGVRQDGSHESSATIWQATSSDMSFVAIALHIPRKSTGPTHPTPPNISLQAFICWQFCIMAITLSRFLMVSLSSVCTAGKFFIKSQHLAMSDAERISSSFNTGEPLATFPALSRHPSQRKLRQR